MEILGISRNFKCTSLVRIEEKQVSARSAHHTQVKPGFFSLPEGNKFDGHDFIPQAIEAGAAAIVLEKERK